MFLADPRTDRIIGEPSADNPGIKRTSDAAGLHVHSVGLSHKQLKNYSYMYLADN